MPSWMSGASQEAGAITREYIFPKCSCNLTVERPQGCGWHPAREIIDVWFENAEDIVQAKGVCRVGQEEESASKADPTSAPEESNGKPIFHGLSSVTKTQCAFTSHCFTGI